MYIVTRKGATPSSHHSLVEATQEAVKISDSPCWIWQVKVNRLETLKRIEVPWEDIQRTQVEGIGCIQNRRDQEELPVDGQLYFNQNDGQVWEYRRGQLVSQQTNQLGRFVQEVKETVKITSPGMVGQYLLEHVYYPFEDFCQEEMYALLLNSRNRITHQVMVYRGTVNVIGVRIAEMFREAVRLNTPSLIIAHNHPSTEPDPSLEDRANACRVKKAGELLGIDVLDYMIVGKNSWVSLKQQQVI
jgi:hypothetical protein